MAHDWAKCQSSNVLCVFWINEVQASGKKVSGVTRFLVNGRGLQLGARGLNEALLESILLYSSETMIWGENDRSRIRVVLMDNLRG